MQYNTDKQTYCAKDALQHVCSASETEYNIWEPVPQKFGRAKNVHSSARFYTILDIDRNSQISPERFGNQLFVGYVTLKSKKSLVTLLFQFAKTKIIRILADRIVCLTVTDVLWLNGAMPLITNKKVAY